MRVLVHRLGGHGAGLRRGGRRREVEDLLEVQPLLQFPGDAAPGMVRLFGGLRRLDEGTRQCRRRRADESASTDSPDFHSATLKAATHKHWWILYRHRLGCAVPKQGISG
jgi:hypothetical protein